MPLQAFSGALRPAGTSVPSAAGRISTTASATADRFGPSIEHGRSIPSLWQTTAGMFPIRKMGREAQHRFAGCGSINEQIAKGTLVIGPVVEDGPGPSPTVCRCGLTSAATQPRIFLPDDRESAFDFHAPTFPGIKFRVCRADVFRAQRRADPAHHPAANALWRLSSGLISRMALSAAIASPLKYGVAHVLGGFGATVVPKANIATGI